MITRREETTLLQLKQEIDKILETRPELSDAVVLIDTEAREFSAHMIDVTSIYAEDKEAFEGMGRAWVTLTPDYKGAISWSQSDADFEKIFKKTTYGMGIDEKPEDKNHTDSYNLLKSVAHGVYRVTVASLPKHPEETCI